jgi:hypothetical protein
MSFLDRAAVSPKEWKMFFALIGSLLAWLGFALGAIYLGMGIYLGSNLPMDDPSAIAELQTFYDRRYGATTGEMVDRGIMIVLGSMVLGMLAKIARRRR